mmetsp:Transcript_8068/g.16096  ORF Transcript_8068/g.16096 Transcript_8068/m.16096 type:complete len:207 (-) Transcript_8068:2-622(-)
MTILRSSLWRRSSSLLLKHRASTKTFSTSSSSSRKTQSGSSCRNFSLGTLTRSFAVSSTLNALVLLTSTNCHLPFFSSGTSVLASLLVLRILSKLLVMTALVLRVLSIHSSVSGMCTWYFSSSTVPSRRRCCFCHCSFVAADLPGQLCCAFLRLLPCVWGCWAEERSLAMLRTHMSITSGLGLKPAATAYGNCSLASLRICSRSAV